MAYLLADSLLSDHPNAFQKSYINWEDIYNSLNQNGSNYFKVDTLIQMAINASMVGPVQGKSPFVKGHKDDDRFIMTVGVADSETRESLTEFVLHLNPNGYKACECFNLIVKTSLFQDWFYDSFSSYLPLPKYKTLKEPRQKFVCPNVKVTQRLYGKVYEWNPWDMDSSMFEEETLASMSSTAKIKYFREKLKSKRVKYTEASEAYTHSEVDNEDLMYKDSPQKDFNLRDNGEGFGAITAALDNGEGFGAITDALDLIQGKYLAQKEIIKSLKDQITKKDKELEAKESEIESLVDHISSLKDHLSLVEGVAPAEVLRYD